MGGAGCALPPSPRSCHAAWPRCNFSEGFSAEKGQLRRQMKGKCWWEKAGQGLFLHTYEGKADESSLLHS